MMDHSVHKLVHVLKKTIQHIQGSNAKFVNSSNPLIQGALSASIHFNRRFLLPICCLFPTFILWKNPRLLNCFFRIKKQLAVPKVISSTHRRLRRALSKSLRTFFLSDFPHSGLLSKDFVLQLASSFTVDMNAGAICVFSWLKSMRNRQSPWSLRSHVSPRKKRTKSDSFAQGTLQGE